MPFTCASGASGNKGAFSALVFLGLDSPLFPRLLLCCHWRRSVRGNNSAPPASENGRPAEFIEDDEVEVQELVG